MASARDELLRLLSGNSPPQDLTLAPAVLRWAFLYCAEHLTEASLRTSNRVDILTMLADLLNALRCGEQVVTTDIRTALKHAVTGERLQQALHEQAAGLARQACDIETVRSALTPLVQQEATLHAQAEEYTRLLQQRAELERLVRLSQHLAVLPQQIEELTQRLAQRKEEITLNEHHIAEKALTLITLSTDIVADLERRAQDALREAERLETARIAAARQLQEAQARVARAEGDLQKLHNELQPQLAANRTVARVLAEEEPPHALLEQVEHLMHQAEAALQAALLSQGEKHALPRLPLMEGRHAPTT